MKNIDCGVWKHKGIEIKVACDGYFYFTDYNGILNRCSTLDKAISTVDKVIEDYYKMSLSEFKRMLNKLTHKEKNVVSAMYEELTHHIGNAYCEIGVSLGDYDIEGLTD